MHILVYEFFPWWKKFLIIKNYFAFVHSIWTNKVTLDACLLLKLLICENRVCHVPHVMKWNSFFFLNMY